jgi:type I restriction enzyme S subunit
MSEPRWDIPAIWSWASAGEIADIVGGGTPSTRDDTNFSNNGIPWITPADLTGYRGTYIERGARDLSEKGYQSSGAQLMPAGTVLFSSRAPIGYCVIAANELSTNQGFKSLVLKGCISPEYVRHYLLASKEYAESLASGTTFKELSGSRTAELALPIAPLAEQRRIAATLDSLMGATARARAELDRIPALISRYKQAILSAAYDGELTREWRASAGSVEPRSATLDELVAEGIRNGLSVRGSDEPPGVRALRLSALRGGTVDLTDVRYLPITVDRAERFQLREGDVLVSRGNGTKAFVGLAALVGKVEEPTIFPDTAFRIRLNQEMARSDWFALLWNAAQVRAQIERAAKTTAGIWKVNQTDLVKIELRLPDAAEQLEIVRRVKTSFAWLDRVAAEHENAMHLLPRLDQAIFAKAFHGELVPQDPNDEPASVLLEHVLAARVDAPKRVRTVREATQKEEEMNKTRKDVSGSHLCDIVKKSGGRIKTDALWQASEMQIDEFYKLLRDNVAAKRLKESKDKASIINAN